MCDESIAKINRINGVPLTCNTGWCGDGAADYAAMAAVNDPYVVLGSSEVRFLAPVAKGQSVDFEATVTEERGKRRMVSVVGMCDGRRVFEGAFVAFVLVGYVLEN